MYHLDIGGGPSYGFGNGPRKEHRGIPHEVGSAAEKQLQLQLSSLFSIYQLSMMKTSQGLCQICHITLTSV